MSNRIKIVGLVAAAALVGGAAVQIAGAEDERAPEDSSIATAVPIAAFDRAATESDRLPEAVAPGYERVGGAGYPEVRALPAQAGVAPVVAARDGRVCLAVTVGSDGTSSITCNDIPGLNSGFLYLGSGARVVGLVPDGVKKVTAISRDGASHDFPVSDNTYVVSGIGRPVSLSFEGEGVAPAKIEFPQPPEAVLRQEAATG